MKYIRLFICKDHIRIERRRELEEEEKNTYIYENTKTLLSDPFLVSSINIIFTWISSESENLFFRPRNLHTRNGKRILIDNQKKSLEERMLQLLT